MTPQLWLQLGTIILAGAAAVLSFLNYTRSGSERVASYRLEWTREFRDTVSAFLSNALRMRDTKVEHDIIQKTSEYYMRLNLLLNPKEELHLDLLHAAAAVMGIHKKDPNAAWLEDVDADERIDIVLAAAKAVLSDEWKRIKSETRGFLNEIIEPLPEAGETSA